MSRKKRDTFSFSNTDTSSQTALELLTMKTADIAYQILEELGTSCGAQSNGDDEVDSASVDPDTIDEINERINKGEDLETTPWGRNASDNRLYYTVDQGHQVVVKPVNEESPNDDAVQRVQSFLKRWMEKSDWHIRQAETAKRTDMHGEVFDVIETRSRMLRLHFAEPQDLDDDPDSKTQYSEESDEPVQDFLGVRRLNNITYTPLEYFVDKKWYPDFMHTMNSIDDMLDEASAPFAMDSVPAIMIMHRKRNVISKRSRGETMFWPVRDELIWAKRLLSNLMRVSGFQAAWGAIRTIDAHHSADAVKNYLASLQGGTGSSGQREQFDFPSAAVVTVPKGVKYEFPDTGLGNSNHIEVLVQLLRACAAGMKLPEFMLTANVSEGNFASTLVSEGPFHKSMRFEQNLMMREDLAILTMAVRKAAADGRFNVTESDLNQVLITIKPPRVQTRNRKEDFEVGEKLWKDGLLSGKELLASEDHEYSAQHAQLKVERADQVDPPVLEPQVVPGPEAGLKGDPLKEPGVSNGDPDPAPTENP